MKTSVVMITMNEELAIAKVVKEITLNAKVDEILIVDSSSDSTPQIALSLGVTVVRQYPPCGYGPAMDLALRSASGDVIVTMDCDGTYPANRISDLVKGISEEGYDLVDGSRLKTKPEAMPRINYFANVFFAKVASFLFWHNLTDLHSGMRAYRRTLIHSLKYQAKGAALPVELLLRPLREGYRVKNVFIDYHERLGVSTMRPLESAYWTMKRILMVRFGSKH